MAQWEFGNVAVRGCAIGHKYDLLISGVRGRASTNGSNCLTQSRHSGYGKLWSGNDPNDYSYLQIDKGGRLDIGSS